MSTRNMLFPTTCPKCIEPTGVVRAAGTVVNEPSIVRLTVRCTICQHEWAMDKEVDNPFSMSQMPQHHTVNIHN